VKKKSREYNTKEGCNVETKEQQQQKDMTYKTNSKRTKLSPSLSVLTIKENGQTSPIQRQR
jgi:hypothetical protein